MPLKPPLETERLLLREFVEDDVEAFYRLRTDPEITRYTGDGGGMKSLDNALAILRAYPLADYQKYGYGRWAGGLKSTGHVIGFAGLKYLDDLKEVDVGYRLFPAHWGSGLATEASRAAVQYGFDTLRLQEIIGLVDPQNSASVRVLQKLGLTFVAMIEYRTYHVARYLIGKDTFHRLRLRACETT